MTFRETHNLAEYEKKIPLIADMIITEFMYQ